MQVSPAVQNAMCDAFVDRLDAGPGPATVQFFTGSAPAALTDPDSGTLLATTVMSDPAFGPAGAITDGLATANSIAPDEAVAADGIAGYWRAKDSTGVVVAQGSCGLEGSGADAEFDNTELTVGGTLAILSMTVLVPAGS